MTTGSVALDMRGFLTLFLILVALQVRANESALDVIAQSGSIDNVLMQADASPDKESSLFVRLASLGWVGWDAGTTGDKIYVFGNGDIKLLTESEKATSFYVDVGPGYKAKLLGETVDFDANVHVAGNFAGDDNDQVSIERTRSARTGAPTLLPGTTLTILPLPSSFFSYTAEVSGLVLVSGMKVGPALRLQRKNYMHVNHGDTRAVLTVKAEAPINKFLLGAEVGATTNSSTIEGYNTNGIIAVATFAWDIGSGYVLNADYQYETRVFEASGTRNDNLSAFHAGVEKTVMRDFALLFDFNVIDNNSTVDRYRYTDNVLALGLKWLVF